MDRGQWVFKYEFFMMGRGECCFSGACGAESKKSLVEEEEFYIIEKLSNSVCIF